MPFERQFNNFPAGWRRMTDAWGDLNSRFFDLDGDLPAWYVENSNSALLSAAAWQCGYPAICEVDVEKKRYNGERGRPPAYAGRMDLEIHINGHRYWIEAKRRAFALSEGSTYSLRHGFLVESLRDAWGDARQCRNAAQEFTARMAAVVFFSAHIEADAAERLPGQGTPAIRERLIEIEIARMQQNMDALSLEMDKAVYRAVFAQTDFGIHRGWQGYLWPAVFGMCAVLDE